MTHGTDARSNRRQPTERRQALRTVDRRSWRSWRSSRSSWPSRAAATTTRPARPPRPVRRAGRFPSSRGRSSPTANKDSINWGPNCDTTLGTVKIPYTYASPCAKPFTGDNGGATADGVTPTPSRSSSTRATRRRTRCRRPRFEGRRRRESGDGADHLQRVLQAVRRSTTTSTAASSTCVYFPAPAARRRGDGPGRRGGDRRHAPVRGACRDRPDAGLVRRARRPPRHVRGQLLARGAAEDSIEDTRSTSTASDQTPEQAGLLTAKFVTACWRARRPVTAATRSRTRPRVFGVVHYDTIDGQQKPAFAELKACADHGWREDRGRPAVPARPLQGPGERPHDDRQAEGGRRHDRRLHRRPADARRRSPRKRPRRTTSPSGSSAPTCSSTSRCSAGRTTSSSGSTRSASR